MQNKYKRILLIVALLLVLTIALGVAYLFYEKASNDETMVEVVGELSVNYIDGANVKGNGEYKFSVTNNGINDVYYEILIDNLKNYESDVRYTLTSKDASIEVEMSKINVSTNVISSNILIPKGETQNFTLKIANNKMTSFDIKLKKTTDSKEYFYATILKNNQVKKETKTKVGIDISSTDEGLIEGYDDLGLTYFFRGNVKNNYVKLGDNMWRIVRINGDGTVKLVLDDVSSELTSYHTEQEEYEDFSKTSILNSLNAYYDAYLQEFEDDIVSYKFCVETGSTSEDKNKTYNSYNRVAINKIPTFNCLGETYSNRIGLLTADEVMYAGANLEEDNTSFYLYNSDIEDSWWTISLAKADSTLFYPFIISKEGKIISNVSGATYKNLRPSISLNRKVIVTGDGTRSNPYIIAQV